MQKNDAKALTYFEDALIRKPKAIEPLTQIAMIKIAAPNMACKVLDWAIQAHGAAGVCDDFGLA